ncbi:MAG: tyrosine-type recombinase/integrase [Alphaproteobacteria bacterium]|nr:tyrosine-type recombinase/integrase [Alphaproteobacteria bacterium]
MDTTRHFLLDDKVQLYMRPKSPHWQCACSVAGKQRRTTTKEESLSRAKDVARDWYLGLLGKYRAGELKEGKTFKYVAERFMDEFEVITQGQRSPVYVKGHKDRIRNYLNPFFGEKVVTEITPGTVQDYRIHRMKNGRRGKPPARSTLHQEIVCLRQVLKTAQRHGWLPYLPDISAPYKTSGKITHRAWFSPAEYKRLYQATRERAQNPKKKRWRTASENMHDFVLFMVNTGLRPDEALRLEFRDVAIVTDEATGERILEIEVRGKRGVGFCKSMPGAVLPFQRLKKRNNGQPTDRLFPKFQREMFNAILAELDLKIDRDSQRRTAYSLRHTYICMRLMEGADIYQIAKNCRTSVEMIENYYASHIKNTLDASAINVRKVKRTKRKVEGEGEGADA